MNHNPKIVVYGLWHLGCVTAASLAQAGFQVCGLDTDVEVIKNLKAGNPPIFEPGLAELIVEVVNAGSLSFTTEYEKALGDADVVWLTFDTPVDEDDCADVAFLNHQLSVAFPHIRSDATIIISSQVPIGFTDSLRKRWHALNPEKQLNYCYSPENLRLGKALMSFRASDRIVVGLDGDQGRDLIQSILSKFSPRLEWMSVRSAEMTKHALNSFLAVSVSMANEIARICERTGADAKEVERGLKSESRIGPGAYLGPGGPFAGGTLARDLRFLLQVGAKVGVETPLLAGALASNEVHKSWVRDAANRLLNGVPKPARVTILGLTYKSGTDTLRRSEAVSLGLWLWERGVEVVFHDPIVAQLPPDLAHKFQLTADLTDALTASDLLIVFTAWPAYLDEVNETLLKGTMRRAAVIDQNRFLAAGLEGVDELTYLAVGQPSESP